MSIAADRRPNLKGVIGMVNWGTNLGGIGALLGAAFSVVNSIRTGEAPNETQIGILISAVAAGFGLLKAKDSNVTGGTKSAVTGAVSAPISIVDQQSTPRW